MSQPVTEAAAVAPKMFELKQLVELLVRQSGISEGLWDLTFEYQVGFGSAGPQGVTPLPSAIVGISKVGVSPSKVAGPYTVDAADLKASSK